MEWTSRGRAWVSGVVAVIGIASCAHDRPPDERMAAPAARPAPTLTTNAAPSDEVAAALRGPMQWLDGLPRCQAAVVAGAGHALPAAPSTPGSVPSVTHLRGTLVPGAPI